MTLPELSGDADGEPTILLGAVLRPFSLGEGELPDERCAEICSDCGDTILLGSASTREPLGPEPAEVPDERSDGTGTEGFASMWKPFRLGDVMPECDDSGSDGEGTVIGYASLGKPFSLGESEVREERWEDGSGAATDRMVASARKPFSLGDDVLGGSDTCSCGSRGPGAHTQKPFSLGDADPPDEGEDSGFDGQESTGDIWQEAEVSSASTPTMILLFADDAHLFAELAHESVVPGTPKAALRSHCSRHGVRTKEELAMMKSLMVQLTTDSNFFFI